VRLQRNGQGLTLRISDNGKGIPKELRANLLPGSSRSGIGLLGMQERLAELGGRLEIDSGGKGTVITAVVPAGVLKGE
jgi:signal transduction histidine kinase